MPMQMSGVCPQVLRGRPVDSQGFTLIELMITSAIMVLVVGGGIASFIRFNEKQTLIEAAKQYQVFLRAAQRRATTLDIPATCVLPNKLWAYRVAVTKDTPGAYVTMSALCTTNKELAQGSTPLSPPRDSFSLPAGVSINQNRISGSTVQQDFYVLDGGIDGNGAETMSAASVNITLTNSSGMTYTFTLTQGGEISEGQLN